MTTLSYIFENISEGFPSRLTRQLFMYVTSVTVFFTVCGCMFLTLDWLPQQYGWFGSVILFLSLTVIAISERRLKSMKRVGVEVVALGAGAFALEFIGVHTGFPFGSYLYTDVLGFRVAGVPLAIGAAWYVTTVCARRICQPASPQPLRTAFFAAILALAFDITLEPVAWRIEGYWQWQGERVPVQNYVAWFLVSFLAVVVLEYLEKSNNRAPVTPVRLTALLVFTLQIGLFASVNIASGYYAEVLLSGMMIAAVFLATNQQRLLLVRESGDAV